MPVRCDRIEPDPACDGQMPPNPGKTQEQIDQMTEKIGELRLYLADDHALFRQGLAALVSADPAIEVVGESGGGVDLLREVLDLAPDVVVLDISMPGLSGLDLCREITRRDKGIAVIILSMHDDEDFVARALQYGASGYVLKESAKEQFLAAVHAAARGEIYLGPGISRGAIQQIGRSADDPYERLTTREREILKLIAEGLTNNQIADRLGVAVKTVVTHRLNLMRKLDMHDQVALTKFAIRKGLITLD